MTAHSTLSLPTAAGHHEALHNLLHKYGSHGSLLINVWNTAHLAFQSIQDLHGFLPAAHLAVNVYQDVVCH